MDTPLVKEYARIGDLLLEKGIISEEDLADALARQKETDRGGLVGEILVEMGACTEDQLIEALAEASHLPFVKINPKLADPNVVDLLPRDFLEQYNVLPLFKAAFRRGF